MSKKEVMYGIVIPTHNNLIYLSHCLNSIYENKPLDGDVAVVVIADRCTAEIHGLLAGFTKAQNNFVWEAAPERVENNFGALSNYGVQLFTDNNLRPRYLVFLNDDTIVTSGWLTRLRVCRETAAMKIPDLKGREVRMVGPVTGFAGGRQGLRNVPSYNLDELDGFATRWSGANTDNYASVGYLHAFCLLMDFDIFEELKGFSDEYKIGGFEDTDLGLRAQEKGYMSAIAGDTYIHHYGSVTLRRDHPEMELGLSNRFFHFKRWYDPREMTLCASYRAHIPNQRHLGYLFMSVEKALEVGTYAAILFDKTKKEFVQEFKDHFRVRDQLGQIKIAYIDPELKFNERRDRNEALKLARSFNSDWIIVLDHDEVLEPRVTKEVMQKLMHPPDPATRCYGFRWDTLWRGDTHARMDGIWGGLGKTGLVGWRMFKNIPWGEITKGTKDGLHCGNIPTIPPECCRFTCYVIRHYGYVDYEEDCVTKYKYYTELDKDKRADLIGADDYTHLIDETTLQLVPTVYPTLTIAIMAVTGEANNLLKLYGVLHPIADEFLVQRNNPDTDIATKEMCDFFGIRMLNYKWNDHYAKARNHLIESAKSDWILHLDPDENIAPDCLPLLSAALRESCDGQLLTITSIGKDRTVSNTRMPRLFRKDKRIKYMGRVHETLEEAFFRHANELKLFILPEVVIEHFGNLGDDKGLKAKHKYYAKLMDKMIKENPENTKALHGLGVHFLKTGNDVELGVMLLTKALGLEASFSACRLHLAQEFMYRAYALLEQWPPQLYGGRHEENYVKRAKKSLLDIGVDVIIKETPSRKVGRLSAKRLLDQLREKECQSIKGSK